MRVGNNLGPISPSQRYLANQGVLGRGLHKIKNFFGTVAVAIQGLLPFGSTALPAIGALATTTALLVGAGCKSEGVQDTSDGGTHFEDVTENILNTTIFFDRYGGRFRSVQTSTRVTGYYPQLLNGRFRVIIGSNNEDMDLSDFPTEDATGFGIPDDTTDLVPVGVKTYVEVPSGENPADYAVGMPLLHDASNPGVYGVPSHLASPQTGDLVYRVGVADRTRTDLMFLDGKYIARREYITEEGDPVVVYYLTDAEGNVQCWNGNGTTETCGSVSINQETDELSSPDGDIAYVYVSNDSSNTTVDIDLEKGNGTIVLMPAHGGVLYQVDEDGKYVKSGGDYVTLSEAAGDWRFVPRDDVNIEDVFDPESAIPVTMSIALEDNLGFAEDFTIPSQPVGDFDHTPAVFDVPETYWSSEPGNPGVMDFTMTATMSADFIDYSDLIYAIALDADMNVTQE